MCERLACQRVACVRELCVSKLCVSKLCVRDLCVRELCVRELWREAGGGMDGSTQPIKGPDNPTCQLLPASHKRKVKTEWARQERDTRW